MTSQTAANVFTESQIDDFVRDGYLLLREAFPRTTAAACRRVLWDDLGLSPDPPRGWQEYRRHLQVTHGEDCFMAAFTPRVTAAFDQLLGPGRWRLPTGLGWWPITFPGFRRGPWRPPVSGWHVDGIQFHHHVNSPDQGLLPIFLFSDLGPGDGGTVFAPGSHRLTAKVLAQSEPDGLDCQELGRRVHREPWEHVIEANGEAGDVLLLHPFMSHAGSDNCGQRVRFLCNPCISLKAPMRVGKGIPPRPEHSPVERAIAEALLSA